ncbi:hypothetical protein CLOACE_12980 [Clostridium acetireducens DSM 10703]|jgi:copper chaperone CopZ|uniref:Uncharacterized protein n=1 Tax=Clostridium acetireducens DSM 10703 TaxID=1121290 RepID=A0A1E8EYV7_9CLOT|nr:cation transporter [Clostridium acetireducens]OFI06043.1 hypothetical protein CLOACE_12980 [Clostridium acetireducens DSM 10703]
MFDLKLLIFKHLNKIKVVHSIPGRLRVKVPYLKNLSQEFRIYEKYIIKAIKILPGVDEITINYVLGTVLIMYQSNIITEEKILSWIKKVVSFQVDNFDFIKDNIESNFQMVVEYLEKNLKEEVKYIK